MFDVVKRIHALRNRVSHHEPLLDGVKMPGEGNRRITLSQAHRASVMLAKCLDRDLGAWFERTSQLRTLILLDPRVGKRPRMQV